MTLESIRTIRDNEWSRVTVERDIETDGMALYTVIHVKEHSLVRDLLQMFEDAKNMANGGSALITSFSDGIEYVFVFPYRTERPLFDFYMGESYSLADCEDICCNVILACLSAKLPYPFLLLILDQELLNFAKDYSVSLDYSVDIGSLDIRADERQCVTACAKILIRLLENKATDKAITYQILVKKIANRSYQTFTELYRDLRIAATPRSKRGLLARLKGWWSRNREIFFRIVIVAAIIIGIVALVFLISNLVMGDIPFLRLFYNNFKLIGTESMLQ